MPCSRHTAAMSASGIHRAGAHRARRPDGEKRPVPGAHVRIDLAPQRRDVHALTGAGGDPADGVGAEAEHVGGLLHPRVRLGGDVDDERAARHALRAHVPPGLRRARREKAEEVRRVAAAHEQARAAGRQADELGDPADGLQLHFGGERRQVPRADVLVERGGQEVAEHADRRRARRDVAEEARVAVEERVIEQQPRRVHHQPIGRGRPRRAGRGRRRAGPSARPASRWATRDRRRCAPGDPPRDRRARARAARNSAGGMVNGVVRCRSAPVAGVRGAVIAAPRTDPSRGRGRR